MYVLLALLMLINVASIAGYAIFTLNPIMMVKYPSTIPFFTISYPLFARLQIAVAFASFALALRKHARYQWVTPFFGVVAVALASELGGTTVGIPFGKYEYSGLLGPKIFGKVPFLVPLSWFFMSVPSFDFAHRLLKPTAPVIARLMVAASFLLIWDVTLDPAMSKLTPFWAWSKPGFYYGAPLTNMTGWFMTGVAIMAVLHLTRSLRWITKLPPAYLPLFYLVNLSLPVGMVAFAGLWTAFALSFSAVLVCAYLYFKTPGSWRLHLRHPLRTVADSGGVVAQSI